MTEWCEHIVFTNLGHFNPGAEKRWLMKKTNAFLKDSLFVEYDDLIVDRYGIMFCPICGKPRPEKGCDLSMPALKCPHCKESLSEAMEQLNKDWEKVMNEKPKSCDHRFYDGEDICACGHAQDFKPKKLWEKLVEARCSYNGWHEVAKTAIEAVKEVVDEILSTRSGPWDEEWLKLKRRLDEL